MAFLIALAFVSGPLNGVIAFLKIPMPSPLIFSLLLLIPVSFYQYLVHKKIAISKFSLLFLITLFSFTGLVFFSSIYTVSTDIFVNKSMATLVPVILAAIISVRVNFDINRFFLYTVTLSLPVCLLFLIYFPQYRLGILESSKFELEVMSSLYLGVGGLAGICVMITMFSGLIKSLFFRLVIAGFFLLTLFISGARAPLIFTVMCIILFFGLKGLKSINTNSFSSSIVYLPFITLILISCSVWAVSKIDGDMMEVVSKSFYRIQLLFSEDKGDSVNTRFFYIDQASKYIEQNLFLGSGIGSYGRVALSEEIFMHPHNAFIEAWFELGVIGFILLFLLALISIYGAIKSRSIVLFLMILFLWLNAMKSFSFSENRQIFIVMGVIISCCISLTKYRNSAIYNRSF